MPLLQGQVPASAVPLLLPAGRGIQRAAVSRHCSGSCGILQALTHLLALVPIETTGTFHAPITLRGRGGELNPIKPARVLARRVEGPTHLRTSHAQRPHVPLFSADSRDPVPAGLALQESTQRDGAPLRPRGRVVAAPRCSSSPARQALLILPLLPGKSKGISQGR